MPAQTSSAYPGFQSARVQPIASANHTRRFLLIVLAIAFVGLFQANRASSSHVASRLPIYFMAALLQVWFVYFVRIGLRDRGYALTALVGKKPRGWSEILLYLLLGVGLAILLRALSFLASHYLGPAKTSFLMPSGRIEEFTWIAVSIIAGICEELIYRGYLQWQLAAITNRLSAAIILQALIFGCAHLYQGLTAASLIALFGLVFGTMAAACRSVIPGAMAHALVDILAGLRLAGLR